VYNKPDAEEFLAEHEVAMAALRLDNTSAQSSNDNAANSANSEGESATKTSERDWVPVAHQAHTLVDTYAIVPIHNSPPVPFVESRLRQLPGEIMAQILGELLGFENEVDVTIPHAKRGHVRYRFQKWFPHLRAAFRTTLFTCKGFRELGINHLSETTNFINRFGDSARNLPVVFGHEATAMI
jgi:hypothetical protein